MKKLAAVIEAIGIIIAFLSMCCDTAEHPMVAIPMFCGFAILFAGMKMDNGWFEIEEEFDFVSNDDDTDDGITYITYDSNGNEKEQGKHGEVEVKRQSILEYLMEIGIDVNKTLYAGKENADGETED